MSTCAPRRWPSRMRASVYVSTAFSALVLGATGGIGGETAVALSRRGWRIRAFSRTAKPADSSGWEWVNGDALERASVEAAA
jgi:uncharacterized protein YbjT (DUF2867 family)